MIQKQLGFTSHCENFIKSLRLRSNPQRAIFDQGYHKSKREHWGVCVPDCVKVVREFTLKLDEKELITLAQALWKTKVFDAMICSTKILAHRKIKASKQVWKIVNRFLKDVDGWALEDNLAHTGWKCIKEDESLLDEVEAWTRHPNFWLRRAALIFTLPYAKPGKDPTRMLAWAGAYAKDPEWFIQKAIGWWLRDLGRHNPKRVITFLNKYWKDLKSVARKEATRKLKKEWLNQLKHPSSQPIQARKN